MLAERRPEDMLDRSLLLLGSMIPRLSAAHDTVRMGWPLALEAALDCGRLDDARAVLGLLSSQPRGLVPPYLHAQLARGRGLVGIAAGEDDSEIEAALSDAIARFAGLGYPYWLAVAQAELGNWLVSRQRVRDAEPLHQAAHEEFTRLRALPRLDAYFGTRASQAEGSSISASVGNASGVENR